MSEQRRGKRMINTKVQRPGEAPSANVKLTNRFMIHVTLGRDGVGYAYLPPGQFQLVYATGSAF